VPGAVTAAFGSPAVIGADGSVLLDVVLGVEVVAAELVPPAPPLVEPLAPPVIVAVVLPEPAQPANRPATQASPAGRTSRRWIEVI